MTAHRTFRASTSAYLILCGLTGIPFFFCILAWIRFGRLDLEFFVATLILPISFAVWLSAFLLRLDASGITYRTLFGGSRRVAFAQLASPEAVLLSSRSKIPLGFVLHLTDGTNLRLNLKPFTREAVTTVSEVVGAGSNKSLERTRGG
jgi:hypothetical protein